MSDNPDVPPSKPMSDEQARKFFVALLDGAALTNETTGAQWVRVDGRWIKKVTNDTSEIR